MIINFAKMLKYLCALLTLIVSGLTAVVIDVDLSAGDLSLSLCGCSTITKNHPSEGKCSCGLHITFVT